jgi:5'-nucleotidase
MKSNILSLLLVTFTSSFTVTYPSKVTILHTNDIHAHLDEFNEFGTECDEKAITENKCYGGVARIKSIVDEFRSKSDEIILVDAGDQFQGTLFFNLYGGIISADVMNTIGYDAMTIGNHEFDSGLPKLAEFVERASFPIISSNIDVKDSLLKGHVRPYIVLEKYNLGIIGYITPTTPELVADKIVKELSFLDPVVTVQKAVNELKEKGVNRIICVSHNGYLEDQQLAAGTSGIDIIVGGHSHSLLSNNRTLKGVEGDYPTPIKNLGGDDTFIVQAHRYGDYLGLLEVEYDENDVLVSIQGSPIHLDQHISVDKDLYLQVQQWKSGFIKFQNDILTQATRAFDGNCKAAECNLGNLITGCMISEQREKNIDADIAFINGGAIRASLGEGKISFADVMTVLPFGNSVVKLDWSGQQILNFIEAKIAGKTKKLFQIQSNSQVSGLDVSFDHSRPEFERVVEVLVGGNKLDVAAKYSVWTIDFVAGGGDNIIPEESVILGDLLAETVASCLRKEHNVTPAILGYMRSL